jgi:hypothetical protein
LSIAGWRFDLHFRRRHVDPAIPHRAGARRASAGKAQGFIDAPVYDPPPRRWTPPIEKLPSTSG